MPAKTPRTPVAGFTLIELLVTVVIAAILMAAAAPTFFDAVERNRIVTQTNEVSAAFAFARSEALRRNRNVAICPSNADQTECVEGADWDDGWLVWLDANGNLALEGGEEILRVGLIDGDLLTASVDDTRFAFNARGGRAAPAGVVSLTLKPKACASGKPHVRRFNLLPSGIFRQTCIKCGTEDSTSTPCD